MNLEQQTLKSIQFGDACYAPSLDEEAVHQAFPVDSFVEHFITNDRPQRPFLKRLVGYMTEEQKAHLKPSVVEAGGKFFDLTPDGYEYDWASRFDAFMGGYR